MMPGAWTKLPGCGCQYHRRFSEDASKFLECGVERRTVFHGFSEEIFMGMPLLPEEKLKKHATADQKENKHLYYELPRGAL